MLNAKRKKKIENNTKMIEFDWDESNFKDAFSLIKSHIVHDIKDKTPVSKYIRRPIVISKYNIKIAEKRAPKIAIYLSTFWEIRNLLLD